MNLTNFKYAFDNKRYHTWNYYLRNTFGEKIFKVSINAGFTCPNIDGKVAFGGCTYCSKEGSGDFAGDREFSINDQFNDIKKMMQKKWHEGKYIAYFQAYTNTYAPVDILRKKYEEAISQEGVVALAIANAIRHNNQKPLSKFVHYFCKKLLTFLYRYVII